MVQQILKFMNIKTPGCLDSVIMRGSPATISAKYLSVLLVVDDGQLFVSVWSGYHVPVPSLAVGLATLAQLFYVLNIEFTAKSRSFLQFLAATQFSCPTLYKAFLLSKAKKELINV